MRSGGQETGESLEWPSPFSAPPAYLECQLHEDDAPRQCPLQVVGGHWRASALKKGKMKGEKKERKERKRKNIYIKRRYITIMQTEGKRDIS